MRLNFLLVALSASTAVQAVKLGAAANGVVAREEEYVRRQASGSASTTGGTRPTSASPSPAPSPTTTSNQPSPTTTNRPTTTSDKPTESSTSKPADPTESSSSKEPDKESSTTSEPPKETTSTLPPKTSTVIETVTNTDGSLSTKTSESVTPGSPTVVPVENNNNNTGMTAQTRNTIIGVVVGVGGAIILAVIGLFAWRMWGRKKAAEENDGLMDYGTPGYHPGPAEPKEPSVPGSASVGTGRSPFQSTLETYHQPTQVNTASNF